MQAVCTRLLFSPPPKSLGTRLSLSLSRIHKCNMHNVHTHHMCIRTHSPHLDLPQDLDSHHLTDGQPVVAQATDSDSPNAKNTVYLKSTMPEPQEPDFSSATDNASQLSDEATNEQWLENGCFPSVDKYRKLSEIGKPLHLTLIYCSQVCQIIYIMHMINVHDSKH